MQNSGVRNDRTIKPLQNENNPISKLEYPTTVRGLMRCLGTLQYLAPYMHSLTPLTASFYEMISKLLIVETSTALVFRPVTKSEKKEVFRRRGGLRAGGGWSRDRGHELWAVHEPPER